MLAWRSTLASIALFRVTTMQSSWNTLRRWVRSTRPEVGGFQRIVGHAVVANLFLFGTCCFYSVLVAFIRCLLLLFGACCSSPKALPFRKWRRRSGIIGASFEIFLCFNEIYLEKIGGVLFSVLQLWLMCMSQMPGSIYQCLLACRKLGRKADAIHRRVLLFRCFY